MDVDLRVEALEAECERLRERIAVLEREQGAEFMPPIEWRLTGSEARVFGCLLARESASKDQLLDAVSHDAIDGGPEPKIVDVFICKVRKKLAPFGLSIETIWGRGYRLSPENKQRAKALIERAAA